MSDTDDLAEMAYAFSALRAPILRGAIQAMQPPAGSRGLDAGCGLGLQALQLAKTVGAAGHVTGLDLSPELLANAVEIATQAGLSARTCFQEGDINNLPFDDDTFDWAWSMDCVGYAPIEPLPLVKELVRVVKPDGSVAILAWSSEKLLPGYPLLEARLNATSAGIAPFVVGMEPAAHFLRGLGWFRAAGLTSPVARTFVADVHSPLSNELRKALLTLFQMRWPGVASELTREYRAAYQRLCLPASPDFILDHPGYYAFFTYSMFHGTFSR